MSRLCVHLSVCVRPCVPCARLRLAAGQSAPLIWNFKGGRYTLTPTADSSGPAQAAACSRRAVAESDGGPRCEAVARAGARPSCPTQNSHLVHTLQREPDPHDESRPTPSMKRLCRQLPPPSLAGWTHEAAPQRKATTRRSPRPLAAPAARSRALAPTSGWRPPRARRGRAARRPRRERCRGGRSERRRARGGPWGGRGGGRAAACLAREWWWARRTQRADIALEGGRGKSNFLSCARACQIWCCIKAKYKQFRSGCPASLRHAHAAE